MIRKKITGTGRKPVPVSFLFLLAGLTAICSIGNAAEEPGPAGNVDASIQVMEKRIHSRNGDAFGLAALGKLYYRKARQTGQIRYYENAESVLRKSLEIHPQSVSATIDLASVYSALHRFNDALKQLGSLDSKAQQDSSVLAIQADAFLEIGDYNQAMELTHRLLQKHPDQPAVLARQAHIEELLGHPERALTLIKKALHYAEQSGFREENLAWYHARLGDLHFHTGNLKEAEKSFLTALDTYPNYYIALSGLADIHEVHSQIPEAIALHEKILESNNSIGSQIALGDLYTESSNPARAKKHYDAAEKMLTESPLHRSVYSRELAYFYADLERNPQAALEIAKSDLVTRKDVNGYDALAWALYKTGSFKEAEKAIEQALRLKTKEPDFYVHAAHIFRAAGNLDRSKYYANEARNLWPYLVKPDDLK